MKDTHKVNLIAGLVMAGALALCFVACPMLTGCATPPSERVVQVQTLKAVGQSAEAAVGLAAELYKAGRITASEAREVQVFYNSIFQPTYHLAVKGVNANLTTAAPAEVVALAADLTTLVLKFQNASKKP